MADLLSMAARLRGAEIVNGGWFQITRTIRLWHPHSRFRSLTDNVVIHLQTSTRYGLGHLARAAPNRVVLRQALANTRRGNPRATQTTNETLILTSDHAGGWS
jgi:hypothetical protein